MRTHLIEIASNNDTLSLVACRGMVAKSADNYMTQILPIFLFCY